MASVRTLLAAEADIEHVLRYTLRSYGARKYEDYAALIQEALEALSSEPASGHHRPDIASDAWTLHIGKPGRAARHLLLYRVATPDLVEVLALAHDAMDLPRHWRSRDDSP